VIDFSPTGYDERQYCSPGINLPVGCLMRARHGEFPEYHTSDDNLSFVQPAALEDSLARVKAAIELLEENRVYKSLISKGEPHLSKYDFPRDSGRDSDANLRDLALRWVLNLSDGEHSLLDIIEKSQLPTGFIKDSIAALVSAGLLARL
jgi:aminopeptidase-like protein